MARSGLEEKLKTMEVVGDALIDVVFGKVVEFIEAR